MQSIKIHEDETRVIGTKKNIFVANGANEHKKTKAAPDSFFMPIQKDVHRAITEKQKNIERSLEKVIGKPKFSDDGFILYQGDCVEFMKKISRSDVKFDLALTSPPYNIGKEYETNKSVEDFVEWCKIWMQGLYDIAGDNAAFWLNLGYFEVPEKGLCVPISYLLWDKSLFYLIQEIVWNYGAGVASKNRLSPRNEKWLWYVKNKEKYTFNLDEIRDPNVKYPNQKKNGKFRCNPLGKNPSDVWEFAKVTSGAARSSKERTGHPAQFPLGVVERVVRSCSNQVDLVVDPFSGSASTGIAAYGLGRIYLGFEMRSDYCDISIERYLDFKKLKNESNSQSLLM